MRKTIRITRLIPAMLLGVTMTGWLSTTLAQETAPAAAAPATAPPAPAPADEAAAAPAEVAAPETEAAVVEITETAAPATEATVTEITEVAPPAAGAAAPATEAAAPAAEAPAAPAAETAAPETEAAETAAAEERPAYRSRYGYQAYHNRLIEQRKAMMKQRRDQLDRWRSWRRWVDNPAAEDRRMWNRARSQMYRDMAEARREYYEQNRPDYRSYEYYPGGGYGYYEEWDYPEPWGGRW